MFHYNGYDRFPNQMTRDLERSRYERFLSEKPVYDTLIDEVAQKMIADFDILKKEFNSVIDSYLESIEEDYFTKNYQRRVKKLKERTECSKNPFELISVLKEVNHEEEYSDYFKRLFLQKINSQFGNGQIYIKHPFRVSSYGSPGYTNTGILNDVIIAVKKIEPKNKDKFLRELVENLYYNRKNSFGSFWYKKEGLPKFEEVVQHALRGSVGLDFFCREKRFSGRETYKYLEKNLKKGTLPPANTHMTDEEVQGVVNALSLEI